jgi:hypothetical protein
VNFLKTATASAVRVPVTTASSSSQQSLTLHDEWFDVLHQYWILQTFVLFYTVHTLIASILFLVYLPTLSSAAITRLFARYCRVPWGSSLSKTERVSAVLILIQHDPMIAIAIRSHYDFTKRCGTLTFIEKQTQIKSRVRVHPTRRPDNPYKDYDYLQLPTPESMEESLAEYIDSTGGKALAKLICGCCGRRDFVSDFHPTPFSFHDLPFEDPARLPQRNLLQPADNYRHSMMSLFDGIALCRPAVDTVSGTFRICKECLRYLQWGKMPPFSQASSGWVGDVPDVLRDLTLCERMLIGRSFTHAYLIKMHPKNSSYNLSSLSDGLVGNVSSVEMPHPDIERMLQGRFTQHLLSL